MSLPKILPALNAVQTALSTEGIGKLRKNEQQHYKFRGIDDCYNAIAGLFSQHKIIPVPHYTDVVQEERAGKEGKAIFVTRLNGKFEFISAEDGSKIEVGPFPGEAMDTADKSTNKAMSASFKYALMQTFTIPTEGDNDADATTHEVAPRQQAAPRQQGNRKVPPEGGAAPSTNLRAAGGALNPIYGQLDQALARYGAGRGKRETALIDALGLTGKASDYTGIPLDLVPDALGMVIEHQKKAAAARKAAQKPAEQTAPVQERQRPSALVGDIDGDDDLPFSP